MKNIKSSAFVIAALILSPFSIAQADDAAADAAPAVSSAPAADAAPVANTPDSGKMMEMKQKHEEIEKKHEEIKQKREEMKKLREEAKEKRMEMRKMHEEMKQEKMNGMKDKMPAGSASEPAAQ